RRRARRGGGGHPTRKRLEATPLRGVSIRNPQVLLTSRSFFRQLLAIFLDHLFLLLLGNRRVFGKFHGVLAFALRGGAKVRRVAEHAVERDFGGDGDVFVALGFEDDAAAVGDLAGDGALELDRGFGFGLHDRL